MFKSWSVKKLYGVFGLILLIIASVQVYMLFTVQNELIHFGLLFAALFIALLLFHSVNIKIKEKKKK